MSERGPQDHFLQSLSDPFAAVRLGASVVTLAVLPPGWICQTLTTSGPVMVAGQCICCPKSPATLMDGLRDIGPTTWLNPRMRDPVLQRITFRRKDIRQAARGN